MMQHTTLNDGLALKDIGYRHYKVEIDTLRCYSECSNFIKHSL